MPPSHRHPRLAVVTADDPAYDERARTVALVAARHGWDVTLLGRAPGTAPESLRLGPVRVRRVVVRDVAVRAEDRRRRSRVRPPGGLSFSDRKAAFQARSRQRAVLLERPTGGGRRLWLAVVASLDGAVMTLRDRAHRRGLARDDRERVVGDWRRDHPLLLDLDLALGPALERLRPDVIHAEGVTTLPTVVASVARMRAAGRAVRWVYGAREHAAATAWPTPRLASALAAVEREYAGRADAVVATSREVADYLAADPALELHPVLLARNGTPAQVDWRRLARLYRRITGLRPRRRREVDLQAPLRPVVRPARGDRLLPWRALGETRVRLGMGMANYAGQLSAQAQALTTAYDDVSVEVFTRTTGKDFGYPSDIQAPIGRLDDLDWQIGQLRRVLPRYTHLLADAFLPVFGSLNGTDIAADLPALSAAGIDVALLAHGSEVRDPRRHREASPFSLFHDAPAQLVETLARTGERNREIAATAGRPVFVTTPDLLAELPFARWVPLVVDVDAWRSDRPVLERSRPVVLHAPSTRWTKGTDLFLPDLERLHERGLIELRLVEAVAWATMRELVLDADIVVDQVAIGSYGAFACEAMAAGKPVVAHLSEAVLEVIGEQPPLVNTAPDRVAATIGDLLDDRAAAAETGRSAAEYAGRVHGGRRSAEVLRSWLGV